MRSSFTILLLAILVSCSKPDPAPTIPMMLLGNWNKTAEFNDNVVTAFAPLRLEFKERVLTIDIDSIIIQANWTYVNENGRDILILIQPTGTLEEEIDFISAEEVYFHIRPGCNCVEKFDKVD